MNADDGTRVADRRTPTTADLRRDNLGRLLRLVHEKGPLTRAALTGELGLARPTVGVLLDWLTARGLLREGQPRSNGAPGRPSPVIEVQPAAAIALALDLGVEAARVAVVGLNGRILSRQRWIYNQDDPIEKTLTSLSRRIRGAAERQRRAGAIYQAVGVACWGVVRNSDGFVHTAPNLGWREVPLGAALQSGLAPARTRQSPIHHVLVANDADVGAMLEFRRGAGIGASRLLYVHSDIGVGGGIVYDGTILGADGGYTGEIGHMRVNRTGVRCHCGSTGCWETEVDERALLRAAGGQPPADTAGIAAAVEQVLSAAREGEPSAAAAVEHVATALGDGLASLIHILGPDRIVLGGYLSDLLHTAPQAIRAPVQERAFSPEAQQIPITAAQHRDDATLLGAAELAFAPLFNDPQRALG